MKDFSNWKTYPQIYQHGTLVGGLDTIKAMKDTEGNLNQLVNSGTAVDTAVKNAASKAESTKNSSSSSSSSTTTNESPEELKARLQQLTTMGQVVLFMKGNPEAPQCGFSRTMVGLLNNEKIEFEHFDILEDSTVREGLKTFSGK